jgi:hypothetical protein
MKKVTVNGNECLESRIIVDNAKIAIEFNDDNIQIFGEGNEVTISANSCNLHIYGDNNSLDIRGNQSNLHIYGDHLTVFVGSNDCNLHIYGTHNDVVVKKGEAVVYGYYGNVTVHGTANVESCGKYKKTNRVS